MRKLSKLVASLVLLMAATQIVQAQNAGYAGKRLVVKTEAVNGIKGVFTGIGLEYAPLKRTSIGFMVNRNSYSVNQRYGAFEYENSSTELEGSMPQKADIQERSVTIEARLYHTGTNRPPAPNGLFWYGNLTGGSIDVDGSYYLELLEPSNDFLAPNSQVIPYSLSNVDFVQIESGFGFQRVIYDWVTIGFSSGLNYTRYTVDSGRDAEKVFSGVAKTAGANIFGIGGTSFTEEPSRGNVGFAFQFQIGLLII